MEHYIPNNPFNITKAVDYTDAQINETWVDLPIGESGFTSIIKPTMPMPMIIIGGKGSGKTHIMRNFSFSLQRIRYGNKIKESLKNDSYLGVYMRCGGINARRFKGKGVTEERWIDIFSYYMELWISQLLLDSIINLLPELDLKDFNESIFVKNVLNLFDKDFVLDEYSIYSLKNFINNLQKNVDYTVNQYSAASRTSFREVEILASPGRLIFGVPQVLEKSTTYFNNFQFLYLIDEFENLEEYHQRYINTLIRERESPATFRIGVRLYGLKTSETYSAGESIKQGSEYERFDIDEFLRNDDKYEQYMTEICRKRLLASGLPVSNNNFKDYFEDFSIEKLNEIIRKKSSKGHFDKLINKLVNSNYKKEIIIFVCNSLKFDEDVVIERTNIFLLYRSLKEGNNEKNLLKSVVSIRDDAYSFYNRSNIKHTQHYKILEKYRNDIIDQICRENNIPIPYYGFSSFVKMSAGIPRVLLKILKEVFKQSHFNGEQPFSNNKISLKSQEKGLHVSCEWFIEDSSPPNKKNVKLSFELLGNFLREIKFSDLPPESSICIFSISSSQLSEEALNVIETLKNYSYLIDVSHRREKFGNENSNTYQIIGIAATRWELSIQRRGVLSLATQETKCFFGKESNLFPTVLSNRIKRYNFPFGLQNNSLPLFEDESY